MRTDTRNSKSEMKKIYRKSYLMYVRRRTERDEKN